MKKEPIILRWTEKEQVHEKKIDRQSMYNLMYAIKQGFNDDNQISTILVEDIPKLVSIEINKDRNNQLEVPMINCIKEDGEEVIKIIRHHKIIWSILNKYCTE